MDRSHRTWLKLGIVAALALVVSFGVLGQTATMNGKEVRAYEGSVVMLNEAAGKIQIKIDDGSTGNWNVGPYTVVMRGSVREPLSLLLSAGTVKAFVSRDGQVQRIDILKMAGQAQSPVAPGNQGSGSLAMNGKPVRAYMGSVNMLNEGAGKIVVKVDDGSTGNWNVGKYTVVLRGSQREPLSLLVSSKRVKVYVSQDGDVQRVEILQM